MFGRPLISCEIGTGTSYVNKNDETGFVVPPEDPASLAKAMRSLLNNSSLTNEMGQAARLRYEQLFSGEALGEAYANLFKELT